MRYQISIDIEKPRCKVIELFNNPDNMKYWQPGLQSFEHLSGEPGAVGSKSKLKYKMGKREIEMIETITENDLPNRFCGTYEADGVWNSVENNFVEVDENRTRWDFETEFRMSGLLMKIMAFLMPGMFKKQSCEFMEKFKEFAEEKQ